MDCFNLRREAIPLATLEPLVSVMYKLCFNLRREAIPLATPALPPKKEEVCPFQSQTRSHPPGDAAGPHLYNPRCPRFNLRREAIPRAPCRDWKPVGELTRFQSQTTNQPPGCPI